MTSEEDVKAALEIVRSKFGGLNAAINCAGIALAIKTLSKKGPHPLDLFQVMPMFILLLFLFFIPFHGLYFIFSRPIFLKWFGIFCFL